MGGHTVGEVTGRQHGMADELDELWQLARQLEIAGTDYQSRGLYQAIGTRQPRRATAALDWLTSLGRNAALYLPGYKEFLPYLDARHGTEAADTLDTLFQCDQAPRSSYRRAFSRLTFVAVCTCLMGQIRRGARQKQHAAVCAASGLVDTAAPMAGGRCRRHPGAAAPALLDAAGGQQ